MINNDEEYIMNYLALLKERRQILNTEIEELRDEIDELLRVEKYQAGDVFRNRAGEKMLILHGGGGLLSLDSYIHYNPTNITPGRVVCEDCPIIGKFEDVFIEKQKIMDIFDNCTDRPEKCGCGDKIWDLL